ncbi:unnamed protein product [Didymodactylos carnosus]|uniref:HMG box domain-containing protein n=1 Tax=Didymodactylos carnosus TaxID=1234261 RepID=A0A813TJV0_9BILA|nr:unnamed protein product [Didymodactylos carnosus]CAF0845691.1 unnamed protein product [Didymodactylos carnosus]CAF3597799.1 unnamed protein product [Didymodactylos carnosus]CAF3630956.1 unnamed protein product [Didymodactylos carnosus]
MFSTAIFTRLVPHVISKQTILVSSSRSIFSSDTRLTSTSSTLTTPTNDKTSKSLISTKTDDSHNISADVVAKMRSLRAKNPFTLFVKHNYNDFKEQYPGLKMTDISKKIGEIWKNLSDQEKQVYVQQSQDQKTLYEKERKKLNIVSLSMILDDEKARKIEKGLHIKKLPTKRPRSAFSLYLHTLERGDADLGSFTKGAAQKWRQMAEQDKLHFYNLHKDEKQKYLKQLVAWVNESKEQNVTPSRTIRSSKKTTMLRGKRVVPSTRKSITVSKHKPNAKLSGTIGSIPKQTRSKRATTATKKTAATKIDAGSTSASS